MIFTSILFTSKSIKSPNPTSPALSIVAFADKNLIGVGIRVVVIIDIPKSTLFILSPISPPIPANPFKSIPPIFKVSRETFDTTLPLKPAGKAAPKSVDKSPV